MSVLDTEFVSNLFTDRNCSSDFLSSVIPNFVAKSFGKKKKTIADDFDRQKLRTKKNSLLKYTDGYIPSVIVAYPVNIFKKDYLE